VDGNGRDTRTLTVPRLDFTLPRTKCIHAITIDSEQPLVRNAASSAGTTPKNKVFGNFRLNWWWVTPNRSMWPPRHSAAPDTHLKPRVRLATRGNHGSAQAECSIPTLTTFIACTLCALVVLDLAHNSLLSTIPTLPFICSLPHGSFEAPCLVLRWNMGRQGDGAGKRTG
jgi:hypothetical protein